MINTLAEESDMLVLHVLPLGLGATRAETIFQTMVHCYWLVLWFKGGGLLSFQPGGLALVVLLRHLS